MYYRYRGLIEGIFGAEESKNGLATRYRRKDTQRKWGDHPSYQTQHPNPELHRMCKAIEHSAPISLTTYITMNSILAESFKNKNSCASVLFLVVLSMRNAVVKIPIDKIKPTRFSMGDVDKAAVEELAVSVDANGLLQPIMAKPSGKSYELVFGLHRLEACKYHWLFKPAL